MLKLQRVEFIEDEELLKRYLNRLFEMVSKYHEEIGSGEFNFATELFITGWRGKAIYVFDLKDGDDIIGFAFVFISHNLMIDKSMYKLSHIYMEERYRGDIPLLTDLLKQIMASKDELGYDMGLLNVSPELMPLAMTVTEASLLYSVLSYN